MTVLILTMRTEVAMSMSAEMCFVEQLRTFLSALIAKATVYCVFPAAQAGLRPAADRRGGCGTRRRQNRRRQQSSVLQKWYGQHRCAWLCELGSFRHDCEGQGEMDAADFRRTDGTGTRRVLNLPDAVISLLDSASHAHAYPRHRYN